MLQIISKLNATHISRSLYSLRQQYSILCPTIVCIVNKSPNPRQALALTKVRRRLDILRHQC
jgi:hypothetical protein